MVSYVASSNKLPIEFGRKFAWQTQYEERVGSPMRTMRENLRRMETVREKQAMDPRYPTAAERAEH